MGDVAVSFRRLGHDDLPLLSRWLSEPHVQEWWRDPSDLASVTAEYGPVINGDDPTAVYVIETAGRPVGIIQHYREADEPEYARAMAVSESGGRGAGIDYLIGEADGVGRGIGTAAIAEFTPMVFAAYPDIDVVTAAPQQANVGSWRALERAGYVRVWAGELDSDDPSDEGPAYIYVRRRLRRLIGIYDADGGIVGELRYAWNRAVRHQHCSLCDITHGTVRPKREWLEFVEGLGVPFDLYHRNGRPASVQTWPAVLAEAGRGLVLELLGPEDLAAVHGDIAAFEAALRTAAAQHGIANPNADW